MVSNVLRYFLYPLELHQSQKGFRYSGERTLPGLEMRDLRFSIVPILLCQQLGKFAITASDGILFLMKEGFERTSGTHRVDGGTPEQRNSILQRRAKEFSEKQPNDKNIERRREVDGLIEEVNEKLIPFLQRYGLEQSINISPNHINIPNIKKILEVEDFDLDGFYADVSQNIVVRTADWRKEKLKFAKYLAHEMIHFQAFQSLRVDNTPEELLDITPPTEGASRHRLGLRVFRSPRKTGTVSYLPCFRALDEAVTEELAKRFIEERANSITLLEEELVSNKRMKNPWAGMTSPLKTGDVGDGFSYFKEREFLYQLIDDIYTSDPGAYVDRDEVFQLFTRAALKGNLLPMVRAIEKARGKGSYTEMITSDLDTLTK